MNKQGYVIQDRRVLLPKNKQKELLDLAKKTSGLTWKEMSTLLDVSEMTAEVVWRKGLSTLPNKHFLILLRMTPLSRRDEFKENLMILKKNWGQFKGGHASASRSRPIAYINKLKSSITSLEFSEFIGILLGDGNITEKGIRITLEYPYEIPYADYISNLINKVSGIRPKIYLYKEKEVRVIFNSTDFVKILSSMHLFPGDKVRNNVGIPKFIKANKQMLTVCLRGLIDTDGGFFAKDSKHKRILMEFKSKATKLRSDFKEGMEALGFSTSKSSKIGVRVQDQNDIKKLILTIGTRNPKIKEKLRLFKENGRMPLSKELHRRLLMRQ
ncbi:MAG: hypothetical protein ABSD68_00685 [Candidatus Micrarchaeales archaeon]|jgi:hypothetical protein